MTLIPMTLDDADKMLEWKNYPETRQFAIEWQGEVSIGRHHQYLVTDGNMQYHRTIANPDGEAIGSIRVKDNEVSIWVDRFWWKHGIATWVLQHHAQRGMTARIVEGNIASMRAFTRAGFLPISYTEGSIVSWTDQHGSTKVPGYYIFKKV